MANKTLYLIGALKNPDIPELGCKIRDLGFDVFDDWHSAGPIADDCFQEYRLKRGMNYRDALNSWAAKHIFSFDKFHLDRSDIVCLVMPAGKSGHLELGYAAGKGKYTIILFDQEPERLDQMHQFADYIALDKNELFDHLRDFDRHDQQAFTESLVPHWVIVPDAGNDPEHGAWTIVDNDIS